MPSKYAYAFAVLEHNFSRILFLSLLTTYGFFYTSNTYWTDVFLKIDILLWLLYWVSHNLEKIMFNISRKVKKKTTGRS